MSGDKLNRRDFLKGAAMAAVGLAAASCAQPTPQVIEKPVTVVVEKEVQVEKEVLSTVIVEKEVAVEKVVQQTVIVETEKVVRETVVVEREKQVDKVITATPVVMKYKEAPMLAGRVQRGELPPVDERLPAEPLVITPWEEIGQYGGTWHRLAAGPTDLIVSWRLCYNNLIRWNKDGSEMYPNVVTGWEINGDNTEFTFSLRKGMKWSDGAPYTADDLAFYYQDWMTNTELTPNVNSYLVRGGEPVEFTKIDDTTYKLTFAEPYPLFVYYAAGTRVTWDHQNPKHYLQQFHPTYTDQATLDKMAKDAGFEFWYQLFGNRSGQSAADSTNPELPVIGAWRITVPSPKQPIVHERNPYYWKVDPEGNQLPYIDRIEHMMIQTAADANMRMIAGEVDMQFRHTTFDNYPLYQESKERGDYRVLEWPLGGITGNAYFFNYECPDPVLREIIRDKRFRYACSLALDRQEIIDGVFLGVGRPTTVSPPPESPFYWEEYATWLTEHDPERANAYLDEMGLTERDSEGYRLRPDGKRLSVVFQFVNTLYNFTAQHELFVPRWKEIGIELILSPMDRTILNAKRAALDYEMDTWATGTTYNPIIRRDWFACKILGPWQTAYRPWWLTGGKEGVEAPAETRIYELYELDVAFEATSDMDEWKRILRQMLEIQKDQMHFTAVSTSAPELVIVKSNFRNVPDKAISDVQCYTPGCAMPEQFFIKQ